MLEKMNLTQYFQEGYVTTVVPDVESLLPLLRKQIYVQLPNLNPYLQLAKVKESWEGVASPMTPDWDLRNHRSKPPSELYEASRELAESGYYDWFTRIYGQFTQRTIMVSKIQPGAGFGWHQDTKLGAFNGNIIFVTPDTFTEEDGGSLSIGLCDSDEKGCPIDDTLLEIETFVPQNGLMITNYNINPNILRKVAPLKCNKELYLIHIYLGYVENTLMKEMNAAPSQ